MKIKFHFHFIYHRYRYIEVDTLPPQQYANRKEPVIGLPFYVPSQAYWFKEEYEQIRKRL